MEAIKVGHPWANRRDYPCSKVPRQLSFLKANSGLSMLRGVRFEGGPWGTHDIPNVSSPLERFLIPQGSRYQNNEDSEFLHRDLLLWLRPKVLSASP